MKPVKSEEIQLLEEGLRRNFRRLTASGQGVLLAISGGPDSMTLLSGAARLAGRIGLIFEAATVDHGLRAGAAGEVNLVARSAARLGIVHHALSSRVQGTTGVEASAREGRYSVLERLRLERRLDWIATAHTASDQAETLLMRLARGAALGGAAGILEKRADRVIRPLLFATRDEVEAYVVARQLEVAHDEMNRDPAFLRVRMRQQVLPALNAAAGPGVERALARFAAFAAEDDAWLAAEAERAKRLVCWPADDTLDGEALSALGPPIARRLLSAWLQEKGLAIDAALLDDALRAARERGMATLPEDRVLSCSNGRVRILPAPARLHATSS